LRPQLLGKLAQLARAAPASERERAAADVAAVLERAPDRPAISQLLRLGDIT
jgi:hypothetical protein